MMAMVPAVPLFRRICNLAESNISIYNAEKQLR